MPASPPDLAGVQAALLGAIGGELAIDPEALFLAPPSGTAAARWHVYESGHVTRLVEAIGNDLPAVVRILGPAAFEAACARYLRACPPRSHDIGRAADRFAGWLAEDPLAARLPFLPDLARFEWALAEAFIAEDAKAARWDDLAAADPESLAMTEIATLPGTQVIRSPWPLSELHELRDVADDEVDVALEEKPTTLVVHRHELEATWQAVSEEDASFLESLGSGCTLASLIDALGEDAQAAQVDELVGAFRRMVDASILRVLPPVLQETAS